MRRRHDLGNVDYKIVAEIMQIEPSNVRRDERRGEKRKGEERRGGERREEKAEAKTGMARSVKGRLISRLSRYSRDKKTGRHSRKESMNGASSARKEVRGTIVPRTQTIHLNSCKP